uniref:Uncharacterized protein n=1 Tax=Arundo donax TaxID=35708 RepID=A0A0A9AX05_ARUDO
MDLSLHIYISRILIRW